jgi:hypothetical protein
MHRKLLTAALVVGTALALTACVPDTSVPTPAPSPSVTAPLFASDEDALAAAEKVYREYLAAAAGIMQGSRPAKDIELVTGGDFAEDEIQGFQEFASEGNVIRGSTVLASFTLQQVLSAQDPYTVVAYACEDISAVTVVDSTGRSLVNESRPPVNLLEVTLEADDVDQLRIISRELVGTACSTQ